jgi:hypothetical protein
VAIRGWAIAALTAALLVAGPVTLAFAGREDYSSVIEGVTPSVPGLGAHVRRSDDFIELRDDSGHEVTIYGYEGEPYARILGNGTVQVNQRSPATYLNTSFSPTGPVPAKASPKASPQWRTQSDDGSFAWFDHRTHYLSSGVPSQVQDPSRKTKIFDYEVPLRIDGRKGAIEGTLFWIGSPAGSSKLPIVFGLVVVLLGCAAAAWMARRRKTGGKGGDAPAGDQQPPAEAW